MAYDGNQYSNRVEATTERFLDAKVVDSILQARTYASRLVGMGKPMHGKTYDHSLKITDSSAGEFFQGLETLNSAASDTLIVLSYSQTEFQQPAVNILGEAMANQGAEQTIDLAKFKLEEAVGEAIQKWGHAIYGNGGSGQPLGLGAIVDDGTSVTTIGGQSRSTYSALNATVTAATAGLMSLQVLATLEDTISRSGLATEEPNINVTTKTIWTLYEQLLTPTMRADYRSSGYDRIALRGNDIVKPADLKGAAGFTVLAFRGKPVIKDDDCTSGVWFMLNERYFGWKGRTQVPPEWANQGLRKVSLGEATTMDGVSGSPEYAPPSSVGWFHMPYMPLPMAAGLLARYYCYGQVTASQFRCQGKETGITTIG